MFRDLLFYAVQFIGSFYYTRDDYDLRLYNQGEYLTAKSGVQNPTVMYEDNLINAIKDNFNISDQLVPPYGEYTVTETTWSWRYNCVGGYAQTETLDTEDGKAFTFVNTPRDILPRS